ncbi:hypothetical protein FPSE_03191 [Fusarium pseudograminearum CS3096]|uniref:Uncharacterized protein n=1 Tax=Fusarium pseudograminearum (strain CS3096) TaxID=1028729 RepID=K3UVI5_FUSPC|nr:hypothetical protein FPSE_03191 [Fusarium pseudograminearum CS3096]EKJ76641.1 hypothetical protein FPSE_03191 [Fusarium pseudograminearum CS3096]
MDVGPGVSVEIKSCPSTMYDEDPLLHCLEYLGIVYSSTQMPEQTDILDAVTHCQM